MKPSRTAAPISLMLLCASAPVVAQPASPAAGTGETRGVGGGLEEVVVTARRRAESVQDVPISIVTKSGEVVEAALVDSLNELDRIVPGFMMKEYEGGGQSTMSLRGISTYTQASGIDQSVGVVVDGVVLGRVGSAVANFNDIERIEVLRGPQGTLFGKNSSAGLVQIVTKDPTADFAGNFSVGYGSYDEMTAHAAVSGALSADDALLGRLSAFAVNRNGYIDNIYNGTQLNDDQQVGARGKLVFAPREGTQLKLGMHFLERSQKGRAQPPLALGSSATPHERALFGGIAGPENDKVNVDGHVPFDDRIRGVNLTWDQELGDFTFTSISSFQTWQWDFGRRAINTPTNQRVNDPLTGEPIAPLPLLFEKFVATMDQDLWSQEFRLASPAGGLFEYVVGAYVNGEKNTGTVDFRLNVSSAPNAAPADSVYVINDSIGEVEGLNYAVFGETDIKVTDTLTLIAGARWTHDEKDLYMDVSPVPGWIADAGLGIGPGGEINIPFLAASNPGIKSRSTAVELWSWRTGARWQPIDTVMAYGTVSRGFKGAGFNDISALDPPERVAAEVATQYEVGLKTQWWDRRVTANLAVFRTNVDDFQAEGADSILVGDPPRDVTLYKLQNVGKIRSQGVELELSVAPTDDLLLEATAAYIDAKFVTFEGAACYPFQTVAEGCADIDGDPATAGVQDLSGRRLPFTPRFSANAAATYSFALPQVSFSNFVRLDYAYRSSVQWDPAGAPIGLEDPVGIVNLSLGLTSADRRFELVGYVKNLTDQFNVSGLEGGHGPVLAYLPPEYQRIYGATLAYRFD